MLAPEDIYVRSFELAYREVDEGGQRVCPATHLPPGDSRLLALDNVHAYYGESHILHGVSLHVGREECVALLGRNGAGKTTTLKSILGLVSRTQGGIEFAGERIGGLPTFQVARRGIAYVPEYRGIFPSLTVMEHLKLAAGLSRSTGHSIKSVLELFPRLGTRLAQGGSQLSGGEQQMLAIARALVTNPRLLILDEPSEGLAPVIVEMLQEALMQIKRSGIPILLVEQNYFLATSLADRVYVLNQGQVKFSGTSEQLQSNEDIRSTYLSV
jgi:branched-chain amino acid transport system ATP-binding protein